MEHIYTIKVSAKNAIIGANTMEQPDEIFIQVANDQSKFFQYIQDPEYQKLKSIREDGVKKMTYVMGTNIDIPKMSSDSPKEGRLYGIGMIYYKPNGQTKMMEFGQKAGSLFMKHKLYPDRFISVMDKGAVIGEANDFTLPHEVRIFFADTPQNLNEYVTDPEYLKVKGIREEGVADYPTFLGMYEKM